MAFNQRAYENEWKKNNLDRIVLKVPKGKKDYLSKLAAERGCSLTAYFIDAVETTYGVKVRGKMTEKEDG